jgi:beta-lactamase regulating signal transducer with metallopeptidase domain/nitrous oxidase accessory protein NosD
MNFHWLALERLARDQFWQATAVMAAVGLLAGLFCRRRPHLAYVLWLVALVKCLTPPVWSSPTSVFSWTGAEGAKPAAVSATTTDPPAPGSDSAPAFSAQEPEEPNAAGESAVSTEVVDVATTPPDGSLRFGGILAVVWLCGAAALGGLLLGRTSYYVALLHHHRVPTDEAVGRMVAELAERLGIRRPVNVLVTTRPFGPVVYGLWRPTLVLPQMLVGKELSRHVERIIAHELIHVRRGDNLVGALQLLAQIVWWFHPLVWWTNRRICREREYCCDEQVVATLRCDPGNYAQGLLDVLKHRRQLRPSLLPGMDAKEVTAKRLEKIMDSRRNFHPRMPWPCWATLIAGILFVVPGAGMTLSGENAGAPPAADGGEAEQAGAAHPAGDLQELVNRAKPGDVVTVPPGNYSEPITIAKPLTLKGKNPEKCVLEVTDDRPAITITSRKPVVIDSLTVKWQLATSQKHEGPASALAIRDGTATVRNCRVTASGNLMRCPTAVQCMGFSNVKLEKSRFDGFEFCILYTGGAEGSIADCVVRNPGHCGITVFSGSKIDVARNILTGSRFHALRCTGGKLTAHDNLIIDNKNRGIYLGNKPASGSVRNNVILGNGAGISAFAGTDVSIVNNLILQSDALGLGAPDNSRITVKNNIFADNPKGVVLFAAGNNQVKIGQNTFWKNKTDMENAPKPGNTLDTDPRFKDPQNGDFTPQAEELVKNRQGLTDPGVFADLWKKWKALAQER